MSAALRCEEIDELDAAYALDALELDERRAVSEHLRSCSQPHRELRELVAVAASLPLSVEPIQPSDALRGRLMSTIAATPQEHMQAAPAAPRTQRVAAPITESRTDRWFGWLSPRLVGGFAAAALAGVVALGAWNLQLRGDVGDRDRVLEAAASAVASGGTAYRVEGAAGRGYLVQSERGEASLVVAGLEELSAGERYQMWLLRDDVPVTAGSFTLGESDLVVVPLDRAVEDHGVFAVTVEDEPVDAPTSDPVMVAELTN